MRVAGIPPRCGATWDCSIEAWPSQLPDSTKASTKVFVSGESGNLPSMAAIDNLTPLLRAEEYTYSPVPDSNQTSSSCAGSQPAAACDNAYIRLLTLHSGREEAEIKCSLVVGD